MVFVDETGIDTFLYREYAFAPRNKKVSSEVSGRRFERQSVLAAQSGSRILAPIGYEGTCDTHLFNLWVEKFLVPELKPKQIVIMDNASIHKSEEAKRLIENAGCELRFLPSYSPDLNPIEHFWAYLKPKLKSIMHNFSSLADALSSCFS